MMSSFSEINETLLTRWSSRHSYWLLIGITLLCLLPFSSRAFHVDDPLFVWSGQQIAKHPLDPYGFQVVWDNFSEPMSEIAKNPPLACYYLAAVGLIAGWSERALHLGFLLPAIALVLGTYRLSIRFTGLPLVATAAALLVRRGHPDGVLDVTGPVGVTDEQLAAVLSEVIGREVRHRDLTDE